MNSHQITLSDEDLKNLVAIFNGILKYSDLGGARVILNLHDKITSQLSQGTEAAQPVVVPAAPPEN